ncbi:MAG: MFS transporter [Cardiobacteriaceae bacterium]|nr:MFS transporter [Cardiobacteriaceae bacterium]
MHPSLTALATPLRDLLAYRERPQLFVLLIYQCITIVGFTLLMPLVSVHFVSDIGMTAAVVGLALAIRQISQQGLTFIGGMLADRYGLKPILCTGLIIRATGFFLLGFATTHPAFFIALLLTGLGGALFDAPFQAATVALTRADERREFYLLANYLGGIAATLGPLLGMVLLWIDFRVVGIAAGSCFLANVIVALRYFPNTRPPTADDGDNTPQLKRLMRDKIYLRFVAILCGYWFVVMQINISFPLLAEALTGSKSSASLFFVFSTGLTLILQYFLVRRLQRRWQSHQLLIAGTLIMTLGTLLLGTSGNFAIFLGWIAVYSVGFLVSRPMLDVLIAHLAHPKALGLYVGFSGVSIGIGGGLGNFIGGWLYDLGRDLALPMLPWSVFAVIGIATAWQLWLFFHRHPDAKTQ